VSIGACVLKPASRGTVWLRDADPRTAPRILSNYLTAPEDRRSMIEGIRLALRIADQPALRAHITGPRFTPKSDSDSDILDFARRNADTIFHPTSTCAIGPVVDSELKVHGVSGLRVVDASVMPSVVRGNTNAATIMIAERAADLIRRSEPLPKA
jgi:choline dehydrogenase-like flavoprotein